MRQIFLYCAFFIAIGSRTGAQIIIQPQVNFQSVPSIDNLYLVVITNPTLNIYSGYLKIKITNGTQQTIFTSVSPLFNLSPGSLPLSSSFASSCSKIFGNSVGALFFSQSSFLPAGSFEICYQFIAEGDPGVIGVTCNQQLVESIMPPYLVDPANTEVINTISPRLVWHPPLPVNLATVTYSIKLTELKRGESYAEALSQNIPLLQSDHLPQAELLYPSTAAALELNHSYVWQVAAFDGNEFLGITEIWSFRIDQPSTQKKFKVDENFFPRIEDFQADGFYLTNGTIRFGFTNRSSDTSLVCQISKIPNDSTNYGVWDSLNVIPQIEPLAINYGMNELSIDLSAWTGWIEDEYYLLRVTDADLRNYCMIIQYVLPD